MSFLETFDDQHTRIVKGKSYTFSQLTTRDYLPWLTSLAEERRRTFLDLLPPKAQTPTATQDRRNIAMYDVTPDDLIPIIATGDGTIKVLELVARKNGIPEEEIGTWIDSGSSKQNTYDAYHFSGIVSAEWMDRIYPPSMPNRYVDLINAARKGDDVKVAEFAKIIAAELTEAAQTAKVEHGGNEDPNAVAA